MLTETQLRILGLVLKYTDLHCSLIAQKLKLTPMAISKAVRDMEKKGFVTIVMIGKSHIVRAKLSEEHLEYYSLAEKLNQPKHPLMQADIEFAIIKQKENVVVAEKKVAGYKTISRQEFLANYKKYEHMLTGERLIINPYNFWKVMLAW